MTESGTCEKRTGVTQVVLWNRLVTSQDTHDQESNTPSAPLVKCMGCERD
jgi:hypothetical protein